MNYIEFYHYFFQCRSVHLKLHVFIARSLSIRHALHMKSRASHQNS